MTGTAITVYEGNDPTLVFMVSLRRSNNTIAPYPTEGRTWEFFVKSKSQDPDPTPVAGAHDPAQDTATATAITVALTAAQVGAAGYRWYHFDVINAGRRETVAADSFRVIGV
jgi:hypothetical protein